MLAIAAAKRIKTGLIKTLYNEYEARAYLHELSTRFHYSNMPVCKQYLLVGVKDNDADDKPLKIYKAITQVLSALFFYINKEKSIISQNRTAMKSLFCPIMLIDGELTSAFIEGENLQINDKENHLLLFTSKEIERRGISQPSLDRYIIDVLRIDYFDTFLKMLEEEIKG